MHGRTARCMENEQHRQNGEYDIDRQRIRREKYQQSPKPDELYQDRKRSNDQAAANDPLIVLLRVSYCLALYASPHAHMESRMGFRLLPSSVREYSTLGGTSA